MTLDRTPGGGPRRRRAAAVFLCWFALALGGTVAGTATANWVASGSGTAGGKTKTAVGLTVSSATGTADLVPGGSGAATFSVSNPNTYAVTLTGLTWSSPVATSDQGAACPGSNLTMNTVSGQSISVPAGASGVTVSFPGAFTLSSSAPNGCQGAAWTVTGSNLAGSSS